jgi:hypothetical protein
MTLDELKNKFLLGELSDMAVGHKLKLVADELDAIFPYEGSTRAKFSAYVNNGDGTNSWCHVSNRFRTLITVKKGFRPFCGNQNSCECNRLAQQTRQESKTADEKKLTNHKRRATNRSRYGHDFASQHELVKQKAEQTCIEKYGAKAPTLNPTVLSKVQSTVQENWGVSWPQQNLSIREKTRQVFEDEYGGSCPAKNPEVTQKTKNTNLEKYGVIAPFLQPETVLKNYNIMRNKTYESQIASRSDLRPLFSYDEFVNSAVDTEHTFQCLGGNNTVTGFVNGVSHLRCFVCYPKKETWGETSIKKIPASQWD